MTRSIPRLSGTKVKQELDSLSREPFRQELARIIAARPDNDALKKFAQKHPDRWASMIRTLSPLAGYNDGTQTRDTNIYNLIQVLPDSELMRELESTLKQLNMPNTIDITPE